MGFMGLLSCSFYLQNLQGKKKKTELKQKQPNLGSHWLKTSKAARFTSQKAGQRENKVPRGNRAKEREKGPYSLQVS